MSSQAIQLSVPSIKDGESQPADITQLLFGRALRSKGELLRKLILCCRVSTSAHRARSTGPRRLSNYCCAAPATVSRACSAVRWIRVGPDPSWSVIARKRTCESSRARLQDARSAQGDQRGHEARNHRLHTYHDRDDPPALTGRSGPRFTWGYSPLEHPRVISFSR